MIREASKFGGNGWLTYDAVFRRNQEGSTTPWNASIHRVYIAGQKEKVIVPCAHCHEIDHSSLECAVLTVLPRPQRVAHDTTSLLERDRTSSAKGKRPTPYPRSRPLCYSWNAGNCKFPGKCGFAHACTFCYGPHPALACRNRGRCGVGTRSHPPSSQGHQKNQETATVHG